MTGVRGVCGALVLPVFFLCLKGSSSISGHRFLLVAIVTASNRLQTTGLRKSVL